MSEFTIIPCLQYWSSQWYQPPCYQTSDLAPCRGLKKSLARKVKKWKLDRWLNKVQQLTVCFHNFLDGATMCLYQDLKQWVCLLLGYPFRSRPVNRIIFMLSRNSEETVSSLCLKSGLTLALSSIHPGTLSERSAIYCSIATSGVMFPCFCQAFLAQRNQWPPSLTHSSSQPCYYN